MHVKSVPYKDTHAAPGSALFEALAAGDTDKAAQIYAQCEREREALETPA
jgi:hypothetical protein